MLLSEALKNKVNRLVSKAWKPPTFTEEELRLPISLQRRGETLVSTQEYIESFANERQQTIYEAQELELEKAIRLTVARFSELPDSYTVGIAGQGTKSKQDLIAEVRNQSKFGQELLESEIYNITVLQQLIAKFELRKRHLVH